MTIDARAGQPLPRAFYEQPTLDVAQKLLGQMLLRRLPHGETLSGLIVETEAYPHGDPALYAYQSPTPRTQHIFGPPGHVYLYATYRIHLMLNIVCGSLGVAESVLIRALEPREGVDAMRANRAHIAGNRQLTSGPGKLTAALGLTVSGFNGLDVTDPDSALQIWARRGASFDTITTTRIGLSRGAELPYRFCIAGNGFVSRPAPQTGN